MICSRFIFVDSNQGALIRLLDRYHIIDHLPFYDFDSSSPFFIHHFFHATEACAYYDVRIFNIPLVQ